MQDNLKLLEEYMKYFGTLKLQLKDNSQKHRRVIVRVLGLDSSPATAPRNNNLWQTRFLEQRFAGTGKRQTRP